MECRLWREIVTLVRRVVEPGPARCPHPDARIVLVWLWAALHDRPVSWACRRENWPIHLRRGRLPSGSTLSRRLRRERVRAALARLEAAALRPDGSASLLHHIDGKPLPIGGCSKDRQAGCGRAARGLGRGYKLHALIAVDGTVAAWRVAPMNKDERVMARRLLRVAAVRGYVVGDSNYDDNKSHDVCLARGELQLVTPRRYKTARGRGHHRHSPGRLRSLDLIDNPCSRFGRDLLRGRAEIERRFGNLVGFGGGLTCLPSWARTHRRVARWVQAKLVIHACYRKAQTATCAA